MSADGTSVSNASHTALPSGGVRAASGWLGLIAFEFLLLRLPVMYLQPGGQDEEFYAVPGVTILQCGIPRMPHIPARNPESAFYRSDEALFSEPPLYFYFQALFYSVLPVVYGTARLASAVAGVWLLVFTFRISQMIGGTITASLWAAGLFSFSRWFYFPATSARPDLLCAAFGLAAICSILRWQQGRNLRDLIFAGISLGLGGLTHPFAIIYAMQMGIWVAFVSRRWHRVLNPLLLAGIAVAVFSAWFPLIAMFPEVFQVQFRNQFGGVADQSLAERFFSPWPSLLYHFGMMWAHIGAIQFLLVTVGLIASTWIAWRQNQAGLKIICLLTWTSVFLLCVLIGPHHPVIGYWSYPAALMFICLGAAMGRLSDTLVALIAPADQTPNSAVLSGDVPKEGRRGMVIAIMTVAVLCSLLPGSGLRTLAVHLRHWGDTNYNSPRFARELIDSLPHEGVYVVDTQFLLDFLAAGRQTLLANRFPVYFKVDEFDYDWLIISRSSRENGLAEAMQGALVRTAGNESDKFACFAEIYRSPEHRSATLLERRVADPMETE